MKHRLLDLGELIDYAHTVGTTMPVASRTEAEAHLPTAAALTTGLESCGLAAADTGILLSRLAAGESYAEVAHQIAAGMLLRKKSRKGRQHVLAALRRRYLNPPSPLARPERLAAGLCAITTPAARNQLLLPYLLSADRGVYEVIVEWASARRTPGARITTNEVVAQVDRVFARHGKRPWAESLKRRWAQGVLSVLRDVGAVGQGKQREEFLPYSVRPEAFGFHLWSLHDSGLRGPALARSPFWRLMLLSEDEARQAVKAVAERGWWRYTTIGGVEELRPTARSLEDWLTNALG
jgi:hypothetical protein